METAPEMKAAEATIQQQSSSSSPTRLQVAIEEEGEEDASEIQPTKADEDCQLPDLDNTENEMKSEVEEADPDENKSTTGENEDDELYQSPIPVKAVGRGGTRGRSNSGRARRSRGRKS